MRARPVVKLMNLPPLSHLFRKPERLELSLTLTPKVCKIMAFMATIMGLGFSFYILLGFR